MGFIDSGDRPADGNQIPKSVADFRNLIPGDLTFEKIKDMLNI